MQNIKEKKKKNVKRRFKEGNIIRSQLPPTNKITLYYVKKLTDTDYILCDYPIKDNPEKVRFQDIDGACYIDNIRVYNYTLHMEKDNGKNVQEKNQSGSRDKSSE